MDKEKKMTTSSRKREIKQHRKDLSSKQDAKLQLDSDEEVKGTEVNGLNQTIKDKQRKEQQRKKQQRKKQLHKKKQRKDLIQQPTTGRFTIAGTVPHPQSNAPLGPQQILTPAISIVGRFLIVPAMDNALAVIQLRRLG